MYTTPNPMQQFFSPKKKRPSGAREIRPETYAATARMARATNIRIKGSAKIREKYHFRLRGLIAEFKDIASRLVTRTSQSDRAVRKRAVKISDKTDTVNPPYNLFHTPELAKERVASPAAPRGRIRSRSTHLHLSGRTPDP